MSVSPLITIGNSALSSAYSQLQTTGHNISNVNTPGYSRQEALLKTAGGQFFGNGFYGRGVEIETVRRNFNDFVSREVRLAQSASGADTARLTQLNQLDSLFVTGEAGMGAAIDNFFGAWSDVSNRAGDTATRQSLMSRADELSARLRDADGQMRGLEASTNERLTVATQKINQITSRIASLNDSIAQARGQNHTPNDLLDQRETLVVELNSYIQTTALEADDGSLNLFVGGGEPLVVGSRANNMTTIPDAFDVRTQRLALQAGGATRAVDERAITGGEVAGLIQFRDSDLNDARNLVGRIAAVVASAANAQHQLGMDKNGVQGGAMFNVGPPSVLPRAGNPSASELTASITDASALMASDYTLSYDGTNYSITRASDGVVTTSAGLPATVDGVQISIASGTPAAGDRFLIRPTRDAAQSFTSALTSPASVAAAAPVVAQVGATNAGNAVVASVGAQTWGANLTQTVTLTFTGANTFDVVGTGTGNPTAQAYTAGSPISFNGWNLTLQGTPAVGDTFTVSLNNAPATNNGNALAFGDLRTQNLIDGNPVTSAYGSLLADVGIRVQAREASASTSTRILNSAMEAQSSSSGVNLDEEAAKLLQYQQSYQAAAKVIGAAQSVFDTLMSVLG